MSTDRLTSANKLALLLWLVAGIAGVLFAHKYYFRAFPEASVNFKVSRGEALARAKEFLASEGQNAASYQSAIVFDVDDNAKTYLERETGLEQANRLMSSELNIWYWDARFFRPQQEEEFHVRVSPAGQVVGYEHHVEEARAGATLARAAAQYAAENFIESKMGIKSGWGSFTGRNQFGEKTEPAGLVIHVGKTWISRQGRAVSTECGGARRPDWE